MIVLGESSALTTHHEREGANELSSLFLSGLFQWLFVVVGLLSSEFRQIDRPLTAHAFQGGKARKGCCKEGGDLDWRFLTLLYGIKKGLQLSGVPFVRL